MMELMKLDELTEDEIRNLSPEQIRELIQMFNDVIDRLNPVLDMVRELGDTIMELFQPFMEDVDD